MIFNHLQAQCMQKKQKFPKDKIMDDKMILRLFCRQSFCLFGLRLLGRWDKTTLPCRALLDFLK
jgi:hypothetical protein